MLTDFESRILMFGFRRCYMCLKELGQSDRNGTQVCGCFTCENCRSGYYSVVNPSHNLESCTAALRESLLLQFARKGHGTLQPSTNIKLFVQSFMEVYCPNLVGVSKEKYDEKLSTITRLEEENRKLREEKDQILEDCLQKSHEQMEKFTQEMKKRNDNERDCKVLENALNETAAERKKVEAERDEAISKYEKALETARTKSVQLESVTKEINKLKEEFKKINADGAIPSELFEQNKENKEQAWHEGDEALLSSEWKTFQGKFNKLHDSLTSVLQKSVIARDAKVLSENMKIVKQLTDVAEVVRDDFMAVTRKCIENIEGILESLFPVEASNSTEFVSSSEGKDFDMLH